MLQSQSVADGEKALQALVERVDVERIHCVIFLVVVRFHVVSVQHFSQNLMEYLLRGGWVASIIVIIADAFAVAC